MQIYVQIGKNIYITFIAVLNLRVTGKYSMIAIPHTSKSVRYIPPPFTVVESYFHLALTHTAPVLLYHERGSL